MEDQLSPFIQIVIRRERSVRYRRMLRAFVGKAHGVKAKDIGKAVLLDELRLVTELEAHLLRDFPLVGGTGLIPTQFQIVERHEQVDPLAAGSREHIAKIVVVDDVKLFEIHADLAVCRVIQANAAIACKAHHRSFVVFIQFPSETVSGTAILRTFLGNKRSLATPKAIDQYIERLIRGKLEDGQLSECPLSLHDIDEICSAFSGILKGVYHERIEYPKVEKYAVQPGIKTSQTVSEDESVKNTEKSSDSDQANENRNAAEKKVNAAEKPDEQNNAVQETGREAESAD